MNVLVVRYDTEPKWIVTARLFDQQRRVFLFLDDVSTYHSENLNRNASRLARLANEAESAEPNIWRLKLFLFALCIASYRSRTAAEKTEGQL